MAELKRNFLKSKMNKDLDERLIPNGEYRDALNVEITSSEGSNSGSVETLLSNELTLYGKGYLHSDAKTVATYVDKENDHIYNFVAGASNYYDLTTSEGFAYQTGIKSDLIEQIKPGVDGNASSKVVIHDIYEVQIRPSAAITANNKITDIPTTTYNLPKTNSLLNNGSQIDYINASGIRVGMRVQAIDLVGNDLFGSDNHIYVTSITQQDAVLSTINITPLVGVASVFSQAFLDEGVILRFSSERVLNFKKGQTTEKEINTTDKLNTDTPSNSIITGVNVIGDYLMWTDGRTEPKKINVKRSIAGNDNLGNFPFINTHHHTHLTVELNKTFVNSGFLEESHITTIKPNPELMLQTTTLGDGLESTNPAIPFLGKQMPESYEEEWGPFAFSTNANNLFDLNAQPPVNIYIKPQVGQAVLPVGTVIKLTGVTSAEVINVKIAAVLTDSGNDPDGYYRVNITGGYPSTYDGTEADEIWTGEVAAKNPLYSDDFIRFAYRYIYSDGEVSCISPYSNPSFIPGVYSYSPKDGYNLAMQNNIDEIRINKPVPANVPKDVVAIEYLFKSQKSENVHAFKKIKRNNQYVFDSYNATVLNGDYNLSEAFSDTLTNGNIVIKSKLFGSALPEDQLLRNFDAVPKKAIAQEIQANRLMYANFTEDYDLLDSSSNTISSDINYYTVNKGGAGETDILSTNNFHATTGASNDVVTQLYTNTSVDGTNINYVTATTIPFYHEYDPESNFDLTNNTFTAPADGYYKFTAQGNVDGESITVFAGTDAEHFRERPVRLILGEVSGSNAFGSAITDISNSIVMSNQLNNNEFQTQEMFENNTPPAPIQQSLAGDYFVGPTYRFLKIVETEVYLTSGTVVGLFAASPVGVGDSGVQVGTFQFYQGSFSVTSSPGTTYTLTSLKADSSIKSMRNYNLGVVYRDDYGRESKVVVSEEQNFTTPKQDSASAMALTAQIKNNAPYWATTYKFFIKENTAKYYNLVLEAAFQATDGDYAYLVFNSADRNKVKTGDYLIQKKKHNTTDPIFAEDAQWRIVSIIGEVKETDVDGVFELAGSQIPTGIISSGNDADGKFFVKVNYDQAFIDNIGNLTDGELTSEGSNNGAVFETEPDSTVDLDLYYEIGQAYAINLDYEHVHNNIQAGNNICLYEGNVPVQSIYSQGSNLKVVSVRGAVSFGQNQMYNESNVNTDGYCIVTVNEPLEALPLISDYSIKFQFKQKAGYTTAYLAKSILPGDTTILLHPQVHPQPGFTPNDPLEIGLPWFNCYSFSNGVESDSIRDDFNSTELLSYTANGKQSGFKAQLPSDDIEEITKPNDIIFSEIFNETSNTNRFNEFLVSKNIIKQTNPDYGSIQKLFSRNNDLVVLCEHKSLRVLSKKDALFNADGNSQLLSSTNVLGQTLPFAGEYGISKNPESFAADEYRLYYVDKNRGAVIRLSGDGISVISNYGTDDWFSDHLPKSEAIVGSFDSDKEEYNVTLHEVTNPLFKKNVYTLSFAEGIDGWSSFKSFIQESGVTVSNRYYTFKNGRLWQHHYGPTRNNFYGKQYESSITPVFNDAPTAIKSFKTINYEGTQSKVDENLKDNEYFNLYEKKGWYVDYVQTDVQDAKAENFKDKEGKWFANVKGKPTSWTNAADGETSNNNLDISEFSIQGLGVATSDAIATSGTLPSEGYNTNINVFYNLAEGVEGGTLVLPNQNLVIYNQTSLSGTYQFTITPNPGYVVTSDQLSFDASGISSISSIVFNDTSAIAAQNEVIATINWNGTVSLTEVLDLDLNITLDEAQSGNGLVMTDVTLNINKGGSDSTWTDNSVTVEYSSADVSNLVFTSNTLPATANWTQFGSDLENVITIEVGLTEGSKYFDTAGLNAVFSAVNSNENGNYNVNYNYFVDDYGNVYKIRANVYFQRPIGYSSSVNDLVLFLPNIYTYQAQFDLQSLQVQEAASNELAIPYSSNIGAELDITFADSWISDGSTTNTSFNFYVDIDALPGGSTDRTTTVSIKHINYPNLPALDTMTVLQDDAPTVALSVSLEQPGEFVGGSPTVGTSNATPSTNKIISHPNTLGVNITINSNYSNIWEGDLLYTLYANTDTNFELADINNSSYFSDNQVNQAGQPYIVYLGDWQQIGTISGQGNTYSRQFYIRNNDSNSDRTVTFTATHPDDSGVTDTLTITQDAQYVSSTDTVTSKFDSGSYGSNITEAYDADGHSVVFKIKMADFEDDFTLPNNVTSDKQYAPPVVAFTSSDYIAFHGGGYWTGTNDWFTVGAVTKNASYDAGDSDQDHQYSVTITADSNETFSDRFIAIKVYHSQNPNATTSYNDNALHDDTAQITFTAQHDVDAYEVDSTETSIQTVIGQTDVSTINFDYTAGSKILRVDYNDSTPTIGLWNTATSTYTALAANTVSNGIKYSALSGGTGSNVQNANFKYTTITYTANTPDASRTNTLGFWHSSATPASDAPNDFITFTQDAEPYLEDNYNVTYVAGDTLQLSSSASTLNIKLRVSDYTTADFNSDVNKPVINVIAVDSPSYLAGVGSIIEDTYNIMPDVVDMTITKNASWTSGSGLHTHTVAIAHAASTSDTDLYFVFQAKHEYNNTANWNVQEIITKNSSVTVTFNGGSYEHNEGESSNYPEQISSGNEFVTLPALVQKFIPTVLTNLSGDQISSTLYNGMLSKYLQYRFLKTTDQNFIYNEVGQDDIPDMFSVGGALGIQDYTVDTSLLLTNQSGVDGGLTSFPPFKMASGAPDTEQIAYLAVWSRQDAPITNLIDTRFTSDGGKTSLFSGNWPAVLLGTLTGAYSVPSTGSLQTEFTWAPTTTINNGAYNARITIVPNSDITQGKKYGVTFTVTDYTNSAGNNYVYASNAVSYPLIDSNGDYEFVVEPADNVGINITARAAASFTVSNLKVWDLFDDPKLRPNADITSSQPTDIIKITRQAGLSSVAWSNSGYNNTPLVQWDPEFYVTEDTIESNSVTISGITGSIGLQSTGQLEGNGTLRVWDGVNNSSIADSNIIGFYGEFPAAPGSDVMFYNIGFNQNVTGSTRSVILGLYDGTPSSTTQSPLFTYKVNQTSLAEA